MKMALCFATMRSFEQMTEKGAPAQTVETTMHDKSTVVLRHHNSPEHNLGVVGSYQKLYEVVKKAPDIELLAYLHDDCVIYEEGWDERVKAEFADPSVGLVGFGGALQHGDPKLYRVPYVLQQLRRAGYRSNVDDAEVHGERFSGSCDVAVLDGFALIVRRSLLDRAGGWSFIPQEVAGLFCYDYALCAMTRRLGYRIRMVGIKCQHLGGRTSVGGNGEEVKRITGAEMYEKSHRWFYNEFRPEMPYTVVEAR